MIVLSTTTEVLRARLTALAATTNPTFSFAYGDDPSGISSSIGILNGTTNVNLVGSPAASTSRVIRSGVIYNGDTAPVTIIIEHFDGTNARQLASITLPIGYTLSYGDGGFSVSDQSGSKLTGFGTSAAPDFISGAKMRWDSFTGLTVSEFSLWIPGENAIVQSVSPISKSSLVLTASTFYHIYAYINAGVPDIEISTTAPSARYFGTARTKTGDTTRRYLGSVLTDASSNLWYFEHTGIHIIYGWGSSGASPQRPLNGGTATTATTVDLSVSIPSTATNAIIRATNTDVSVGSRIANSLIPGATGATGSGTYFLYAVSPASNSVLTCPVDSVPSILYWFASTPTGAYYIDVFGYEFER